VASLAGPGWYADFRPRPGCTRCSRAGCSATRGVIAPGPARRWHTGARWAYRSPSLTGLCDIRAPSPGRLTGRGHQPAAAAGRSGCRTGGR
jgi:hypothetical protein